MVDVNVVGSFWLAARPDKRVAGRLTFDAKDGTALELSGSFHDPREVLDKARAQQSGPVRVGLGELLGLNGPPVRILGNTPDGPLTLDGCLGELSSYHVPLVFHGAHFDEVEPLRFDAVKFQICHLAHWVWKSGLGGTVVFKRDSQEVEQVRITYTPLEESVADTERGKLTLAFKYSHRGDRVVEHGIEQHCSLELRFHDSGSIDEIFEIHDALQALITIGVAAPAPVTSIELSHAGTRHPIQLRAWTNGTDASDGDTRLIDQGKMLFTYDAIGGLEGIGQWLKMSKKFRPVLGVLTSRWYTPQMYDDLHFFYMVTAAEAFERIRRQEQNINFKEALTTLATDAGAPFQALVGDVNAWAGKVVQTRNNHVVHRGLHDNLNEEYLFWLTGSVYILVVLCLLRECGLPESALPNDDNCKWMRTLAAKFQQPS